MCGRYVIIKNIQRIEKKFGIKLELAQPDLFEHWSSNFNVSATDLAPIIKNTAPRKLIMASFGYSPVWSEKRKCILNTRTEGKNNPDNNRNYKGGAGVLQSRMWGPAIRSRRCIVIADAFIEGPEKEKLSKPYVVYVINEKPIALAGLWNDWTNSQTGEVITTFSIMTHVANDICHKIGHHRSPVVLKKEDIGTWLNTDAPLAEAIQLLKPFDGSMNAYPVDPKLIKSGRMKDKGVIQPVGERIMKESEIRIQDELKLFGMGESPARSRKKNENH
jgi:putative SOS response-associated peptidase YedK